MKPEEQGFVDPQDPRYVTYMGRRMLRMIGATGEVPDPAPEPPIAVEPPVPVADPAPAPTGPWADQLARFDEALRPQVDEFLRTEIQPYITRLEQERPQVDPNAVKLYEDLNGENAAATYLALTGELFDPELAEEIKATLVSHYGVDDTTGAGEPAAPVERDPEVQAVIDAHYADSYKRDVSAALEANAIPEAWSDLIHPMIVSADGDIAAAAGALKAKLEANGVLAKPPTVDDVPDPPPVPGVVPPAPPVAKNYGSDLGAAIDDFLAQQANTAPPPVGTV